MRCATLVLVTFLLPCLATAQEAAKPLTPEEAFKKVDEKVTVQMEVKSTGGNTARYLNSESDFRDAKNFTIFIPAKSLDKIKAVVMDDPAVYYKGKTIQVTGTVVLDRGKPQIRLEDSGQIKVIEKDATKSGKPK